MRYIDRILQPGQTVLYRGRIHWVIYLPSTIMMLLSAWFKRWTTEIDVTNRRIVYKVGFIKRHTVEMNMDKVESVDVDQSIMGRLLNYGDIAVRGTGETWERLHN